MTASTAPSGRGEHSSLAWAAVAVAAVAAVSVTLAVAGLGGGGAGVMLSLAALVMAVVAKVKHERWAALWFPLLLFPALLLSAPLWV